MIVHVSDPTHLRFTYDGDVLPDLHAVRLTPVQLLAAALAACTATVMRDYATTAQFQLITYVIDLRWQMADHPRRVEEMTMRLELGSEVPPSRHAALMRAVEQHCTVHNTLSRSTEITTTLEITDAQQA